MSPTETLAASTLVEVQNDGIYGHYQISNIRISPDNRKRFNEQALQELADSIKSVGVAQPILIRPVDPTVDSPEEFEIVAGERRYRASKLAGKETIPAVCRNLGNLEAAKLRILENLQREDPHPLEEAEGYQLLMMQHGLTADQLADEVKKSRAYVYARLKLCALTPDAREPFLSNQISASIALLIARIPVPALQVRALNEILKPQWGGETLSYRAAALHVQQRYMLDLKGAVFKVDDAKLLKIAGACTACPKRAGNQPEVFEGIGADVCTDPDCYGEKKAAHFAAVVVQASKKGIPVHEGDEGVKLLANSQGWGGGEFVRDDSSIYHFERNAPHTRNHGDVADYLTEKTMPAVAAYAKNGGGELVALYKRTDIQQALEAAGACETEDVYRARMSEVIGTQRTNPAEDAKRAAAVQKQAEYAQKARDITAFRVALYSRIREGAATKGLTLQSLREITKLALCGECCLPNELDHLYNFDIKDQQAVNDYIDQAELPEVQLLLIDGVLGFTLKVTSWEVERGAVDEDDFGSVLDIASNEGIDPTHLHEEMFPSPIDVNALAPVDLAGYLKPRLNRINEIKDKIIQDRPELIGALERAATELGYVYGTDGFELKAAESPDAEGTAQPEPDQGADAAAAVCAPAQPEGKSQKKVTKKAANVTSKEPA